MRRQKALIEARLIDCIVNLHAKLFLNTQIPACLWFLNRNKPAARREEVSFIDARNLGHLINRRTKELSKEDIQQIASTYHNWKLGTTKPVRATRESSQKYEDIKGFCNSASIDRIQDLDFVLTPGRYVGLSDEEDDFDFKERFTGLQNEQMHWDCLLRIEVY